ncbi:Membrane protein YkvI [Sphingomonas antarctica]|uniref:YkvI family membrane protein n=1 Tax=Sphingomonas antarctica TaxID=2040274 RepID=UPI0039E96302
MTATVPSDWFRRLLLPGLAFKAVVIGGGYATGREIAEFFLPAGPWGGLAAMAVACALWTIVCALTFAFAQKFATYDYRSFFGELLGRLWPLFECAYALFLILILAVFGAAAGELGAATLHLPKIVGTVALLLSIGGFAAFGNEAVERLFGWVSILLYGAYALFLFLALTSFGGAIGDAFAHAPPPSDGWLIGGLTYAGYNIVGAVVILPVLRHMRTRRDAVIAGAIAGPLAMLPALLFFVSMCAFAGEASAAALPSDLLLGKLGQPWFRLLFQAMIFAALLESGTGAVHAINERIAGTWRARRDADLSKAARAAISLGLLAACMLLAERVGLVALIASGYRLLAGVIGLIFVIPLLVRGTWKLRSNA